MQPKAVLLTKREVTKLKQLFSGPLGIECLAILNKYFYNVTSYTIGDPHHTSFMEGHRDVIQFLNNCMAFDSEQAIKTEGGS